MRVACFNHRGLHEIPNAVVASTSSDDLRILCLTCVFDVTLDLVERPPVNDCVDEIAKVRWRTHPKGRHFAHHFFFDGWPKGLGHVSA